MYIFWAEINLIRYSWPYRRQLLNFGQPFHPAWPRTIINAFQYPQKLRYWSSRLRRFLERILKLKSLVHWLWEYDYMRSRFNDIHDLCSSEMSSMDNPFCRSLLLTKLDCAHKVKTHGSVFDWCGYTYGPHQTMWTVIKSFLMILTDWLCSWALHAWLWVLSPSDMIIYP